MALIRWDPFAELNSLHDQVNSLFNDTFGNVRSSQSVLPATDIYQDDKALTIETHLPNFKQDEVIIQQHNGELEIKAEHKEKDEDGKKDRKYLVRESVSRYYRRFALPKNVDADNIKAEFSDGMLKVVVPFKELPAPKRIAIEAGTTKSSKHK